MTRGDLTSKTSSRHLDVVFLIYANRAAGWNRGQ